jgi:hypothetical protein
MIRDEELKKEQDSIKQAEKASKNTELEKQREERRRMMASAFDKKREQ